MPYMLNGISAGTLQVRKVYSSPRITVTDIWEVPLAALIQDICPGYHLELLHYLSSPLLLPNYTALQPPRCTSCLPLWNLCEPTAGYYR